MPIKRSKKIKKMNLKVRNKKSKIQGGSQLPINPVNIPPINNYEQQGINAAAKLSVNNKRFKDLKKELIKKLESTKNINELEYILEDFKRNNVKEELSYKNLWGLL